MKETACNLCANNFYTLVFKSKWPVAQPKGYAITQEPHPPEKVIRCMHCGLMSAYPVEPADRIFKVYQDLRDEKYLKEENGRRQSAKIILNRISKFKRGGRILDIGSAVGFLLDEAKKLGWFTFGIEPSRWGRDYAQRFGLEIIGEELAKTNLSERYFDVITMVDVIEHLVNPKETLIQTRRILKNDGLLFISTPDVDSLASRILKAKWWGIKKYHLFYFSKETLGKMLDAAGFKIIKFNSHPRVFSALYLIEQLQGYGSYLYPLLAILSKWKFLDNLLIKVNFGDQIQAFARKKSNLQYLHEDEGTKPVFSKKCKVIVALPAYNASKTLKRTLDDIPKDAVDDIILVDDHSKDNTVETARRLGLRVFAHDKNKGYGANQKTCYTEAIKLGADIVVMVHPDYQYDPRVIPELIRPIKEGRADAVFGSRMMKGGALEGGMPAWKHNANILLTALENVILGTYLTEYHSGFRAYSSQILKSINFMANSDGFIFDTEIIVQILMHNFKIEEIPIRTRYFDEASSIKLWPSVIYGLGIIKTLLKYILHVKGLIRFKQFR